MTKPIGIVKIILMSGCVLSFFISSAQDYYEKPQQEVRPLRNESAPVDEGFSVAVSVGPAIPLKSFASTKVKNSFWDFNSADSVKLEGFAKTGIHFNVTARYLFPGGIGVMFMLGSNANSFDIGTFSQTTGGPFTTTELFHTREYLIGPYISFSEWPKFTFEANAMIGLVAANYPSINLTVVDTTESITFSPARNFGYSFGGAVKYSCTNKIGLSVNVAYTQARIVYHGWNDTYTAPGYYPNVIPHPTDLTTMPMGILKITAGIVYKFH